MAEINDLEVTDGSNVDRFPEGMALDNVNDNARKLEGLLARGIKDAVEGTINSTGTGGNYVVAANRTIGAYYDGMRQGFHANHANTGAATLNIDSVGAKSITKNHDVALIANDIEADQYVEVVYSASDDAFQLLTPTANGAAADVITTRGDVIRGDASGDPERLAIGAADTALVSDGTDVAFTGIHKQGLQTIWVPAAAMSPTVSNGCSALTQVEISAGQPDLFVLDFATGADDHAQFSIAMPKNWNEDTITAQFYWCSTATDTDGVTWGIQGIAFADGDAIGQNWSGSTPQVIDDANQSTANDLYVTSATPAITILGSPAAGELSYFRVFRDVSDANDIAEEDARLIGVKLFYTTNAGDDT